jgi:serine/threonine-protein kinase
MGDRPIAAAASTVRSSQREHETIELRAALLRLAFALAIAMPCLVPIDLVAVYSGHRADALPALLALRVLGVLVGVAGYLHLRRRREHRFRDLVLLDYGMLALAGVITAQRGVILGAALTATAPGLQALVLVRGTLVPAPWRRTLGATACAVVAYAACLAVSAWARPAFRAEVANFTQTLTSAIVVVGVACIMSHLLWTARREVYETQRLGRYQLIAKIGHGGHGEVWLARQEALDRDVAIKVLRDGSNDDGEMIARFRREAHLASQLAHPNTIRIIDYGVAASGVTFLAMELLSGTSVAELVAANGPLPPARVIHLARQACGSLAEAHDAGIIHRDIKPANLYVTRTGDDHDFLKILDFGIARATSATTLTRQGDLLGTLAYMAPEMCAGEKVDARNDVYSLGATLYFMLTGQPVFRGTLSKLLAAHVNEAPKSPSERLGQPLPEDLERVVMRCLAKSPADRYQTMREVEAALSACTDSGRWTTADSQSAWRRMHAAAI